MPEIIETAQMFNFFLEKVRCDVVKTLEPSYSFHPLAYCGDPASYAQECNIAEFIYSDIALDVIKLEAILKRYGR
jgi:creatinine amidohydrolase